jgi:FAD binding domain
VSLTDTLAGIVGAAHVITDPDVLAGRSVDHTGRYRGHASALVRPGSADEVAAVLRACRDAGVYVTVQGGRTSLVAGTVPEHDDVLLSTERLRDLGEVDVVERRVHVGAGGTLAEVQRAASAAGLVFGVDLAARDSATVGGMASTNAGGLRTVRYGNMGEQILGMDVALPDGSIVHRHNQVRRDNTGYDLASLFVGAEAPASVTTCRCHAPSPISRRCARSRPPSTHPDTSTPQCCLARTPRDCGRRSLFWATSFVPASLGNRPNAQVAGVRQRVHSASFSCPHTGAEPPERS